MVVEIFLARTNSVLPDNENLFASIYMLYLPTEEELKRETKRERYLLEEDQL